MIKIDTTDYRHLLITCKRVKKGDQLMWDYSETETDRLTEIEPTKKKQRARRRRVALAATIILTIAQL